MSNDQSKTDDRNGSGQAQTNDGSDEPSTAEKVVMGISVTFTVLLFAYVLWQAIITPSAVSPEANVIGTSTMTDGDVRVRVELINNQDIGLTLATVEVDCSSPPPELEFQHVPADGRVTGYVTCPSGTSSPEASVSTWIET